MVRKGDTKGSGLDTPLCQHSPDQEEAKAEKNEEPDGGEEVAGAAFFLEIEFELEGFLAADLDLALKDDAYSRRGNDGVEELGDGLGDALMLDPL